MPPYLRLSLLDSSARFRLLALSLFGLLFRLSAHAQAPAWQDLLTPTPVSGNPYSQAMATAADSQGNVYLAGFFSGTILLGTTTLTSAGGADVFVAKWSSTSNRFLWVQRAGGLYDDGVWGIAVSGSNVYLTGFFHSATATFGPTTLVNAAPGGYASDVFVTKLTDTGSFVWAQRAGGPEGEYAKAIAVSGSNVYVTGYLYGATAPFGNTILQNAGTGTRDVFLAKLTDAGTTSSFTWAQRVGGPADEYADGLAVNGTSVYLAGCFQSSTMAFGNLTVRNADPTSPTPTGYDLFVVKLTDAGASPTYVWAQQAGGLGSDYAEALALNGPNVYVAGQFASATLSLAGTTLRNDRPGTTDVYVTKLVDAGTSASFAWAQRAGGGADEYATSVAVRDNSVYVAGEFASPTADFGRTLLTNTSTQETSDVFVTKLTDQGSTATYAWAQQAGSAEDDQVEGLVATGTTLYVGGTVQPPARFGGHTLATPTTRTVGFLASLPDGLVAAASPPVLSTLRLYPNPATSSVTVQVPAVAGASYVTFTLTDALGRILVTRNVAFSAARTTYSLSLAGITPGVYALRVQAGSASAIRQLVVE